MSNHLARRGALVAVAALVVAIASYFLFERAAPPTIALDRTAHDEGAPEPSTPVAELAPAPSAELAPAPSADLSTVPSDADALATDESRAAVGSALVGATWGELLVAVDRGTRQPIEGATIALVDSEGERREVSAADAVLESDLADGALVALAAPMHLTRVFFAQHLRDHTGAPRAVSLHPTGGVRVRLVDEDSALAASLSLQVFTIEQRDAEIEWGDEAAVQLSEATQPGPRGADMQRNLRFIASADSDVRERKRQMRWLSRSESIHPLLTPDGPPATTTWNHTEIRAADPWPRSVADLPVGFDAVVKVAIEDREEPGEEFRESRPGFEFRIVGGDDAWSGFENSTFIVSIDAGVVTEIEVRGSPPASVRGLLPLGARSGRVHVVADSAGVAGFAEATEVGADGAFHITDLKPGASMLVAHWKRSDSDVCFLEFEVQLEPGRELDLGRLTLRADGRTLTLTTTVLVDGEPASAEVVALLEGAQLSLDWSAKDSWDDSPLIMFDDVSVPLGATVTLSGLAPTRGRLSMRAEAESVGERLEGRFLLERIFKSESVDLTLADQTLELFVNLETAATCAATLTVPAGSGRGHVSLQVQAFELEGYTTFEFAVDGDERLSTAQQHTCTSSLSLPRGEWLVVAVARPADESSSSDSEDDSNAESFIGTARLTIGDAPTATLAIELAPAARLRVAVPEGGGAMTIPVLALQPVGLPRSLASLAMLQVPAAGSSEILHGLLPDTEYVDRTGSLVVRTGAPGSVTELDLR